VILGVDIGQRSGWALARLDGERVEIVGHGTVKVPRKEGPAANLERLRRWWDEHAADVTEVWIEGVGFAAYRDAHASYWRVRTVWEIVAAPLADYPVPDVPTSTLKRWATGKGNADKLAMVRAARERYGVDLRAKSEGGKAGEEDAADACHVAAYGATRGGEGA